MDILIIGGGGREHALAWKLAASPQVGRLFASPGSDAIAGLATCVSLGSHDEIADFAAREHIDLTVVGPEAPLVDGLADHLIGRGLRVFGPTRAAAALEGSKAFAKAFMKRHGIPTSHFAVFDDPKKAVAHLAKVKPPYVVKADGLAAGKGVSICPDRESAETAIKAMMVDGVYGQAGHRLIVEGFSEGEEASFFAVCDGEHFVVLPTCQDHKPIGDLDRGANTGGMGAYCPAPVMTPELEARVIEQVVRPTLRGMAAEGHPFSGVLYVGLMIKGNDIDVLEYNCRFGDPECQPLMMMLDSDLAELLLAAAERRIETIKPRWRDGAAVCIVLASGGYPGTPDTGHVIEGLEQIDTSRDLQLFHAGTRRDGERWRNAGGRVLGVTAWGETLAEALQRGYHAVGDIRWPGRQVRRDIGLKGLRWLRGDRPQNNVGILLAQKMFCRTCDELVQALAELGIGHKMAAVLNNCAPDFIGTFISDWEALGMEVFVAIADEDSPLPHVLSASTRHPVIQVPLEPRDVDDAEAPVGVGTGTVAARVMNGNRAALFAAEILALKYHDVSAALQEFRLKQTLPVAGGQKSRSANPK
ncbi:MAG: phosphoribosylamine--glycine ligase [Candidatus Lambdaproteobacteria bacterium]|nr:phosphoribosylamine--glycine ligase [Candidatus Lambdaproteobacteria bacterium]